MPFALATLILAMASIQFGASMAKQLFPIFGPSGVTAWRLGLAALILCAIWRPWRVQLSRPQLMNVVKYGASLGLMNLFFYLALQRIPLGVAVALEFTGPLALALWHSRRWQDLVWALLATLGLALLFPWGQEQNLDMIGAGLAVLAGVCWAFYIITGQGLGKAITGGRAVALGMSAAALIAVPIAVVMPGSTLWHPESIGTCLLVAIFSSALPYSLEMIALKRLPPATFSILMSLEPGLAALMGWAFLAESLSVFEMIAIGCIIVASLGSTLTSKKETTPSPLETPVT